MGAGTQEELTICRSVHYVAYGTPGGEYPRTCRAAVVTEVTDDYLGDASLLVMNPSGLFFNQGVKHDPGKHEGGTWHWPHECKK